MPAVKSLFRVDATGLQRKAKKAARGIRATSLQAELMDFARKSLTTAVQLTPERSAQLIRRNQAVQYAHRINYIPSYHTLENPTLIVNERDEHWIYCDGKWYRGEWHLPDHVYAAYQDLLSERIRRMRTDRQSFINSRSQARLLYKKSWWQVGRSIGLNIPCGASPQSYSRHNPPKEPPKGYAQLRGGKQKLTLDMRNPFLEQPSRYKSFTGRQIIQEAANRHRAQFEAATGKHVRKLSKQYFA